MSTWYPIKTAPKDGTNVELALKWSDGAYSFAFGSWWVNIWASYSHKQSFCSTPVPIDPEPTHWRPEPKPPEAEDEKPNS